MNKKILISVGILIGLTILQISFGETGFNFDQSVLMNLRLPKVIACIFVGGSLAIAGLLMQLFFQNPLAGPDILGVSSGATFSVSLWLLASSTLPSYLINLGISIVSLVGSVAVVTLLLVLLIKNQSKATVLIIGILIASVFSSATGLLINSANAIEVKNFLIWSQGTFRRVYFDDLKIMVPSFIFILSLLRFFIKDFTLYSLGENYARSMGLNILKTKFHFVLLTSVLISISIYYCGPISFIGVVAPFLGRRILKTSNLNLLFVIVFILGSSMSLISDLIQVLNPAFTLNANVVLGLIGAPIIIFYAIKQPDLLG
jgi:iron complex transport system permease protein